MNNAPWETVVLAAIALVGSVVSWFRAQAAHKRINKIQGKQP